jgi:hypothetical protein
LKYSSKQLNTRRATDTTQNMLSSFNQQNPNSVDELYETTLPEMRSKLRKKGLKQVGYLTPISKETFESFKYSIENHQQHNAFEPNSMLKKDVTLELFEPKQWIGERMPDAKDDLVKEALEGLVIDFRFKDIQLGELISYAIQIQTISELELNLLFQISIYQSGTSKIIVQAEKNIKVSGDKWHRFEGTLSIDTSSLDPGSYQGICKIFKDNKSNLVGIIGPFEYHLLESGTQE